MPDGREISLYTLENDRIRASVSDLGAVLVRLFVPGRDGRKEDIVLGFDPERNTWTTPTVSVPRSCLPPIAQKTPVW